MKAVLNDHTGVWCSKFYITPIDYNSVLILGNKPIGTVTQSDLLENKLTPNGIYINHFTPQLLPLDMIPVGSGNYLSRQAMLNADSISARELAFLRSHSNYQPVANGYELVAPSVLETVYLFADQFTNKVDLFSRLPGGSVSGPSSRQYVVYNEVTAQDGGQEELEDYLANPSKLGDNVVETNIIKKFIESDSPNGRYDETYVSASELKYYCKYIKYNASMQPIKGGVKCGRFVVNGQYKPIELPNGFDSQLNSMVYYRIMSVVLIYDPNNEL